MHVNHPECGLLLGFTAKAASKVDSSEKGRCQNNIRSIKCPPFRGMESSSRRCQDKT